MAELTTLFTGRQLIKLTSVNSTSRYLTKLFSKEPLPDGSAVMAGYQSAGEGMAGSYWHSENGKNLLLSILFIPHFLPAKKVFLFNKAMAVALFNTISQQLRTTNYELQTSIKWPNDIYIGDKKICGIKIENSIRGQQVQHIILGIGLNINQEQFPSDLPNPVSLKMLSGNEFSVDECFTLLCNEIEKQYLRLKARHEEEINQDYLKSVYRINQMAWFEDASGTFQGMIKDVDEEGRLCIQEQGGNLVKYEMKDLKFIV